MTGVQTCALPICFPVTIQQNYGEAKDHGWLLWTIDSRSEWDVQFRGLERHDEYMDVFNRLMIDANASNVDHIFIAGDIFHTKVSGITPEFIDILTNWLLKLSYIAPVHMMLGNHDGNLVNASRQDAISPIVNAINSDRIKLYKKSGVFEFAPGYEWVVFSPFDVETWDSLRGNSENISTGWVS